MESKKKLLLIMPSIVVARGLENVFSELGEFEVTGIISDLSRTNMNRLRNMDADAVILDPSVFDYETRRNGKNLVSEMIAAPIIALEGAGTTADSLQQYDGSLSLFDEPVTIIKKVRAAIHSQDDAPKAEGNELSAREKEILICVAKGMLNKEIADKFNLSIYTVITHRKNITRKTGIKTVAGLTVYALLNNLIDINSVD